MPKTLFDKIWESHVVSDLPGGGVLLFIDRHFVHEVTSPQAFAGLREKGRRVRRPDLTFATADHDVPTNGQPIDLQSLCGRQLTALERNTNDFGVAFFGYLHPQQGIVHAIGPELGITLPGLTIVCGDSHTATHGAFGALAFGIGTSEVEHVLATQTLRSPKKPKSLGITVTGELGAGVSAKDVILAIIHQIGAGGGAGYVAEYRGSTIQAMDMAGRMTVCNMSIEMGARAGLVAPDEVTMAYIAEGNRPYAPKGADFDRLAEHAKALRTDAGASYDLEASLDVSALKPQVTWGTTPAMTADIDGAAPEPKDDAERRAQRYMGIEPGTAMRDLAVNTVFIGSCTNGRIEDLRAAAALVRGRKVASGVRAFVVPGSGCIKAQAEKEGLDATFREAGFEWHNPGCSMCLGMNGDIMQPGERSASTSNRPFEGRQGAGSRTHLVSPVTAAASAIAGHLADPRELL